MRPTHRTLDRGQVHASATQFLQHYLPLNPDNRHVTASTLCSLVLYIAAAATTFSASCRRFRKQAGEETLRQALHATLPEREVLQRQLNDALAGRLPKAWKRRLQHLAIDLTLIPYYGKPCRDPNELYRGQPQRGTSRFHAYATAYLMHHGQRYTVALTMVHQGEPLKAVVQRLLQQVRSVGIRPGLLLLDSGFYSVEVIAYLKAARCPFLMPVRRRGRKPDHPKGPSGTQVFAAQKRSGWFSHRMTNRQETQRTKVEICVVRHRQRNRKKQLKSRTFVYACWRLPHRRFSWVRQTYRKRFGIETSYRQMNEARGRTTSKRPEWRLLLVGVALLLRNEWIWLHAAVLSSPRRGGRQLHLERLPLGQMLQWLRQVVEATFGTIGEVMTEREVCLVVPP